MRSGRDTADDFDTALRALALAEDPTALFGPLPSSEGPPPPAATSAHRRLARLLHPDRAPARRGAEAAAAFTRLTEAWSRYQDMAGGGLGLDDLTLATRAHTYHVRRGPGPLAAGDIADLHEVRYKDGGTWREAVLKLPRSHRDNDLATAETTALRRIRERAPAGSRAFYPELVEQIRHRDAATGAERRGNVLTRLRGFHSLADVRRAHPDGVDPRDAAWMWRRLLVAVGNANRAGVVHGAVVPEHVLIHPGRHGLVLVDWCYSVTSAAAHTAPHIPAMVPHRGDLYPEEVLDRRPAVPATDVHMATRCVEYLTAGRLPRPLRAFVRGCTLPAPERRPGDGIRLLGELDEALERAFGPRRFRPFHMPATV
ncbi:molecular chaperone DnaJ [Nocardiopsis sp. TSRI0078]|uniref:molecular chaperone DnaJ n=1 Tax=unclassified Nocardiopsis TaxID=2649073 RepID=UPI00093C8BF7|nr:molecular chaperone DnaJ [Nocardiopsis sp. TSRI0078]OKI18758.1 molecular chaperone DnaJ [Nocardiopsis sp. TSRI0078]